MVERSLRMREARGSIPRTSIIFIFAGFPVCMFSLTPQHWQLNQLYSEVDGLGILLVESGMVFDVWRLSFLYIQPCPCVAV